MSKLFRTVQLIIELNTNAMPDQIIARYAGLIDEAQHSAADGATIRVFVEGDRLFSRLVSDNLLDTRVDKLDLPNRVSSLLERNGVRTIRELVECTEEDVLFFTHSGQITLRDIKVALRGKGLELKHPPE